MHPEIRQPGPGSCPICGMALEPEVASADAGPNPGPRRYVPPVLNRPGAHGTDFLLEMAGHLTDLHQWLGQQTSNWIQLLLHKGRLSCCGQGGRSSSGPGPRSRPAISAMFTLIAMKTGVAWIYSIVGTILSRACYRPRCAVTRAASEGADFEAAAVITVLVLLGQVLERKPASRPAARPRPPPPQRWLVGSGAMAPTRM